MEPQVLARDGGIRFCAVLRVPETEATAFQPFTHAVTGLRHGSDLLMLRARRSGLWEFAGGFIDAGETPRKAAVRELQEETGQSVETSQYVGVMHYDLGAQVIAGQTGNVYGALYIADAASRDITLQAAEHDTFRWLPAGAPLDEFDPLTAALIRVMREQ